MVIDAGYESTVPIIEANIRTLGFKVQDVKILLNTQAHYDHAAGFARFKKDTGAQLMVSGPDADVIERGGTRDFSFGDAHPFPAAKVDRRLKDGDTVTLDTLTLHAHVTPAPYEGLHDVALRGHRQQPAACTWWTCAASRCSTRRASSAMPRYPDIVSDYERTFAVLRKLQVDIFIGAHPAHCTTGPRRPPG